MDYRFSNEQIVKAWFNYKKNNKNVKSVVDFVAGYNASNTDYMELHKPFDTVKLLLPYLSDKERILLFDNYCKYCGSNDPRCQCWNDD